MQTCNGKTLETNWTSGKALHATARMMPVDRRQGASRFARTPTCIVLTIATMLFLIGCKAGGGKEALDYGHFRNVTIHGATSAPSRVILFVSEKGPPAPDMKMVVDALADDHTLVIWIDVASYMRAVSSSSHGCLYSAGDFEMLSQYVQRRLGLGAYRHPILIGHGQGAALVYAVVAEAPQTFPGAISIDFCPDLAFNKTLCQGKALAFNPAPDRFAITLLPSQNLNAPWFVFQTQGGCPCDLSAVKAFVNKTGNSRFQILKKEKNSAAISMDGLPEIKAAVQKIAGDQDRNASPKTSRLEDLPLVELPCSSQNGTWLAVIVSGDGGWAGIDSDMGEMLSAKSIPVVGLDSLKYFWTRRTPDSAARDLARIIDHYCTAWKKRDILLIGYSRGADVLPFMVNRLPEELRSRVKLLSLLGLSHAVSFEFHLSDWIRGTSSSTDLPIRPEIVNLKGMKILCFCGDSEDDSLCPGLGKGLAETIVLKGGHHFGGEYTPIINKILSCIEGKPAGVEPH